MNLSINIVIALLSVIACISVSYGINNAIATSIISQESSAVSEQYSNDDESTIIQQQSSQQLQSNSISSSLVTSENIVDGVVSSTNKIVSRILDANNTSIQIDKQSFGKIASSHLNTSSGEVEAVLFGDWFLNSTSEFIANFTYTPVNGSDPVQYVMSGFEPHSISQINDNLVLSGTIDVASNGTTVSQDAPVTIIIHNNILIVGFEKETEATDLFGGIPIIGFEE
jgi:hypothetical protein